LADVIRLLIADDHAVVRQGLRLFLDLQPDLEVVGEADNGRTAVDRVAELAPDVVLMDVVMPELDGIGATEELRERAPETRVLVLSSFDDEESVLPALRAGASGYLLKQTEPDQLAAAIRAVHKGEPVLCAEATERVLHGIRAGRQRPEGTVTVLFTDIEGSTTLLERLGEEQAHGLFREHDRIVRDAVGEWGGTEVETAGDAFMLAFSSARRAVGCAAKIQQTLAGEAEGDLAVRIGLNTGDVIAEEDRYFGRAVFIAARIAATAAGREILVSELTRNLASDGVRFVDRGLHKLKGLTGEHRLFEVEWKTSPF